jgi:hypothetical protein
MGNGQAVEGGHLRHSIVILLFGIEDNTPFHMK